MCEAYLQVLANFGDGPFKADVESMKAEALERVEKDVQNIQLPSRGKVSNFSTKYNPGSA